jgi:serine/threonine protein kinase
MAVPTTTEEFLALVRKSGVVDEKRLDAYLEKQRSAGPLPEELGKFAGLLVRDAILTHFQADQLLLGKWRRFNIGKYKVLERIGAGGMGMVFLCEHVVMRRKVAVKVLPTAKAESEESSAKERFQREARAVAALDHPNIVRVYDIDHEDGLHFLVMEYIDGSSLQEIVKCHGPLDIYRAAHYIAQAARGLEHARVAKVVHRDIKPGNILVDRLGVVKVLDMGLALKADGEESLITQKYDENTLGTADYLAPEQAINSHDVDIRADIYSLGCTFYFCLTGNTPFNEGTVAQKLIWHQTRQPRSIQSLRQEVPDEMAAIIEKMMAKDPNQRYSTPVEVAEALSLWTQIAIGPPPEKEMPRLSPAAGGTSAPSEAAPGSGAPAKPQNATGPSSSRKWEAGPTSPRPRPATPPPAKNHHCTTPASKRSSTPAPRATPQPARATKNGLVVARQTKAAAKVAKTASPHTDTLPDANSNRTWESLAPETPNPNAQLDTAPQPAAKRIASSSAVRKRKQKALRWKIAAGVGLGGLVLIVLMWAIFRRPSSPSADNANKGVSQPATWYVTDAADQPNAFRTLREAVAKVGDGDHIIVQKDLDETLILDGRRGKEITVEAGNPNQRVRWSCPAREKKLIDISNLTAFRLKGFLLDGQERVNELITLSGSCRKLILDDLDLQGFKETGVALWNCTGNGEAEPVVLRRIRLAAREEIKSAVSFSANQNVIPAYNQAIQVIDCRFEGPFGSAVRIAGPVLDLKCRGNRFYNVNTAFLYTKGVPRHQIQLNLEQNTFCDVHKTGLHFEGMPLASNNENRVALKNNLFFRTGKLVQVDETQRLNEAGLVFRFSNNVRDGTSQEGNVQATLGAFPGSFTLDTNPADDAKFLRYPKNHPLGQAGVDQQPVGVPPVN